MQQRVELKRLGDEVGGALLDRVDGILHRPESGDHVAVGVALAGGIEHAAAVVAGAPLVGDEDVEGEGAEPLQRFFAARHLLDVEAVIGQAFGDRLAQRPLVVHDQQMFLIFRHLVARAVF